ncbi:hypothetical protein [Brevibacillus migulae]|uniref:hypothetical protein n=1 Tax=Brevibacillus migulae TaxID=1644114 RepID=UPI00106F04D9|nr:hypothetical protein [Brevibacillus migulae]
MLEKVQGMVIQGASTQNVLPSSTSSPWEPALIGATIGFVGAITAQIVSHFFTQRRETQKFNKEIYQNLFAPVLLDVYSYLDIVTHFRKHHDLKYGVNESDFRDKIINHIGTNLKYASPNLILSYEAVLRNDYEEDFSGYLSSISDLDLMLQFLDDLYELNQRTKLFDEAKTRKVNQYRVLYLIWVFLARYESLGVEKSAFQVAYKFYFSNERLTAKFYDEVNNFTGDKREKLNYILKSLIREEYTNEVNDVFFQNNLRMSMNNSIKRFK